MLKRPVGCQGQTWAGRCVKPEPSPWSYGSGSRFEAGPGVPRPWTQAPLCAQPIMTSVVLRSSPQNTADMEAEHKAVPLFKPWVITRHGSELEFLNNRAYRFAPGNSLRAAATQVASLRRSRVWPMSEKKKLAPCYWFSEMRTSLASCRRGAGCKRKT